MEKNDSSAAEARQVIRIERTFHFPLAEVWRAWWDANRFKKWWGPKDYSCPNCTIDFKVGGKYLASMMGPDGIELWSTGIYKEIVPMKRIVYTDNFADSKGNLISGEEAGVSGDFAKELLVTLQFEGVNGTTKLVLKHEGIPSSLHDECVEGWQSSLDKLAAL
jgi:uncharacterized protein YndB with AHSA1/START domain